MRWLVIVTALTRLALSVVLILAAVFCIVLADGPRVFTTECLLSNSLILMLSSPSLLLPNLFYLDRYSLFIFFRLDVQGYEPVSARIHSTNPPIHCRSTARS